ncbi:hypothetical protein C8R45DRAFT_519797 [Mycena sanguinolenta]|nr:hypothetical protein C8R45DRAFT_519797 [Mycena sanguinolenta]
MTTNLKILRCSVRAGSGHLLLATLAQAAPRAPFYSDYVPVTRRLGDSTLSSGAIAARNAATCTVTQGVRLGYASKYNVDGRRPLAPELPLTRSTARAVSPRVVQDPESTPSGVGCSSISPSPRARV